MYNSNMVAQLAGFVAAPLFGEIADRYGSAIFVYILSGCFTSGLAILTLSIALNIDWLLFPAFILIQAFAASAGGTMIVKTGLVFNGQGPRTR